MSKHLVLDVIAMADDGYTREQIAQALGISVKSVTARLAYARRSGRVFKLPPRKRRMARVEQAESGE